MTEAAQREVAKFEDLTGEERRALELIADGGSLKDIVGVDDDTVEALYALGYNFYVQDKYEEAEKLFQYVCLQSHLEPRYWMALANCRQMLKKYDSAIDGYGYTYVLKQDDPWPVIQGAICHLKMGNKELAAEALTLAEMTIEEGPANEEAKSRISALRASL